MWPRDKNDFSPWSLTQLRMILSTAFIVFLTFFSSCRAAYCDIEQVISMRDAITSGSYETLASVLDQFQGDINGKPFDRDGTLLSPLELAAAHSKPDLMSLILEMKQPVINLETFEIVFTSECVECLTVLLDHPETFPVFIWAFNRRLFQQILKLSYSYDQFFELVSKFSKRVSFNDKLALIENAFEYCDDHELISFTIDAVILDISYTDMEDPFKCDKRAAAISLARALIFKHDYDELLPVIEVYSEEYPINYNSKELINGYKELVENFDDRIEEYPQPEYVLLAEQPYDCFIRRLVQFTRDSTIKNGIRVLFRLLNSGEEKLKPEIKAHLDILLKSRYRAMIRVSKLESIEGLKIAFEHGMKLNFADRECIDALLFAARKNSVERLDFLLQNGENPDGTTGHLNVTLIESIQSSAGSCVEFLLKKGADPKYQDRWFKTPFYYAIRERSIECINLLFNHGVSSNDLSNFDGQVPLIVSVNMKCVKCTELLLKRGADPNAGDIYGMTPLITAVEMEWEKGVELLLNNGADINFRGNHDETPLIAAVLNKYPYILRILLDRGADPNVADELGRTALSYAIENESDDLIELLQVYGATH